MAAFNNHKGTILFYGIGDELLKERTYFTLESARVIVKNFLKEFKECTHYHFVPNLDIYGKWRRGVKKNEDLEEKKDVIVRPPAVYSNKKSLYE